MKVKMEKTTYHIKNQKVDPEVEECHQLLKKSHEKLKALSMKSATDKDFFIVNYLFFENFKERIRIMHNSVNESLKINLNHHGIASIKEEE